MSTTVSIVRCPEYREEQVYKSIAEALDLLGGLRQFISPGEKVLLKPNLLIGRPPEKCVTTHPLVVKAVARMVREAGAFPVIGDSPQLDSARKACDKCGIGDVARELGVEIVEFEPVDLSNPDGRVFKNFTLGKVVKEVDKIINLAKLKTHSLTTLTLAVKNMFGCVPAARKGQWHVRTHTAGKEYFARMLLDLYYFVKPTLNIVDGIIGMEGQGPGFGDPRPIGLVIAGADGVAVDRVIAEIVNIPAEQVPILMVALRDGYGTGRLEEIAVLGESIEGVKVADFKTPQFQDMMAKIPGPIMRLLKAYLTAQPTVKKEQCVECEMCLRACPRECITHPAGAIRINEEACIQCLCCMEICPQGAIELRPGFLLKLFSGIRKVFGRN
ncbi:MAG: DUF362 domain-containing protein [Proteobacteria bacterium]|nr:DUF362 domain-containing protein [Pseudomonadota bacterium]